jgi:ArsR family transcriptional regulator
MEKLIGQLRAAGEPTRLRLISLLAQCDLTVTDLTQILGQSQPRISRHLKLLTEAGLVERFREGAWVFYRLNENVASNHSLGRILVNQLPANDQTVLRDADRLEKVKRARADAAAAYFRDNADEWGRIRSLYIPEVQVESAMLEILGDSEFEQLVDLGTGTGRILEALSSKYESAIGIDLSHEMLSIARVNLENANLRKAQVRYGDLYALTLEDQSVDVVTVHHVLHFLDDPSSAVAEAARVLKPGGRLLIVDFAPHELEFLRDEHAHRRLGFTDEEVQRWFDGVGLECAEIARLPQKQSVGQSEETLTVSLWLACRTAARAQEKKLELAQ